MKRILLIALSVAVLAAFFASSFPDGLDYAAEKLGFAHAAVERTSIMTGYSLPFLPQGTVSTAAAGIAGVLIALSVFWIVAFMSKRNNSRAKKILTFIIAALITFSLPSFAARPLVTDDFGTVDAGRCELECGYRGQTPETGGDSAYGMYVQVKRGITSNLDLGFDIPYSCSAPSGVEDANLHVKYKIAQFGDNDGIAAKLDMKLTNGNIDQDLGTGHDDYTATLVYSKEFGGLRTHYNLGYTIVGKDPGEPQKNSVNYSAAVEKEIVSGIDAVAEYYVSSTTDSTTGNIQIGGRWQALEAIRLDAGYSVATNDNSDNVATAGMTAEF